MRLSFTLLLAVAAQARGADFTGSRACAGCHSGIYRSFMQTPMSQSSGRIGTGETKERFDDVKYRDSAGAYAYTVSRDSGKYFFEFLQQRAAPPIQGRRELEYFIGSGSAARSYVMNDGGFLYEAPVAYYRSSASWNAAPGFAPLDYPFLSRPILPGCLNCHSSRVQRIAGTYNKYSSPPFLEGGVACERCHGPASDHIASGAPMVNPARLAPAERDSVCEQCHLAGEMRVAKPGKDDQELRAGERLSNLLTVFVRAGSGSELRVTSHAENLAQSACKRSSGDKMWCGSCHDPHSVPSAETKVAYFREKCLNCHKPADCSAPAAARQASRDNCVSCHMPRNPTSDVEHVVFTDHSIRKRPSAAAPPRADADLVPFRGGEPAARDQGLAYALVGQREQNTAYLDRAFTLLRGAVDAGARDAQTLAYLAEFYRNRKDDAHALPLYQQAWSIDTAHYPAAAALGAYAMQRGNYDEAIGYWNRTLEINPALVLVRLNLATALLRTGRADQARQTLEKALEFNPAFQEGRALLDQLKK